MRTVRCLFGLAVALLLTGSINVWGQLPSNELEGTWKMVSQELVYPDSVVDQSDDWGPSYKILNSTHFAWGRETKNGETVLAGGGRYEYYPERNVYIEHIQYHSDTGLDGVTLRFKARVEGDTWYHIGDIGSYKLREVWKRVDAKKVRAELRGDTTSARPETAGSSEQ